MNGDIIKVDKLLHFSFCYIIATISYLISLFFQFTEITSMIISLMTVIIISVVKEWFDDKIKGSVWDTTDIVYGITGGILALIILRI